MSDKTISLTKPITTHEGPVAEMRIREPKGRDFLQLGEPWAWTTGPDGERVSHPVPDVIDSYFERCLVSPGVEYIGQLGLADGMKVREALLGFFGDAALAAFSPAAISSSSTSGSSQAPSGASSV